MTPGTLHLFSSTVPIEHTGSFIILHRHLSPLVRSGWRLKVYSNFEAPAHGRYWEHHVLPRRRPWWPPVSPASPLSQRLRARLMIGHLRRTGALVDGNGPRVLLANLWDYQALFAAELARGGFARLGVFFHDDEIQFQPDLPSCTLRWRRGRVTAAADRIWAVSGRLVAQLDETVRSRCRLLRPIPGVVERRAAWSPWMRDGVHLGYAGKVFPGLRSILNRLAGLLARLGGRLTVITDPVTAADMSGAMPMPGLTMRAYFERPDQAVDWLRSNCSVLLVAYPTDLGALPRAWRMLRTSFPSKLPEYAQAGLPLVLIGDRDSELGDWADSRHAPPLFHSTEDSALADHLAALRREGPWREAAGVAAALADGEFSPPRLQEIFAADVADLSEAATPDRVSPPC